MKKQPWLALIGLCLVSFLGCIDFTIVNTALPDMQKDLAVSATTLQWVISGFLLALSALMILSGRIADIHGRKKYVIAATILFGFASLGAGLSTDITWLIIFRILQGVAIAVLYTIPMAIIMNIFDEQYRHKAGGILIGVNGFGLAIGPVLGGCILAISNWHWIFYINIPFVILGLLILIPTLPETFSHEHGNKIDWLGGLLLVILLPVIIFAIMQGADAGWFTVTNIVLYIITIFSAICFYLAEKHTKSPIILFHMFRSHQYIVSNVAMIALAFFYTADFFLLPLYLHQIKQLSGFYIGLYLLPAPLLVAIISPFNDKLIKIFGCKKLMSAGFLLFFLSAIAQWFITPYSSVLYIVFTLVLFGLGWSIILTPAVIYGLSALPNSISGVAMGSLCSLHNYGGVIGLVIAAALFAKFNFAAALIPLMIIALVTLFIIAIFHSKVKT